MERESQPARTGLTQALALNNDIWRASFYRFCQLLELENPYACPHGRPTIITMSKYELEKKFKRIV